MTKYFDKTDFELKSLEVSFTGMEWTDNGIENIPKTTDVTVRLLEKCTPHFTKNYHPYIERWTMDFTGILVPTGVWNGIKLGQLTKSKVFVALGTHIYELDTINGKPIWTKSYAETSISLINLSSNEDALYILYTGYQFKSNMISSNLIKIDLTGNLIWSAKTKREDDSFIDFNYENKELTASTWNGWRIKLNEETGRTISEYWTK
jgi:hypothetical protein